MVSLYIGIFCPLCFGQLSSCRLAYSAEGLEAGGFGRANRSNPVYCYPGIRDFVNLCPDRIHYNGSYTGLYGGFWLLDIKGKNDFGTDYVCGFGYYWRYADCLRSR